MIIIGLGNPGSEYLNTRHSLGFEVIDHIVSVLQGEWARERNVDVARIDDHWFIKPLTYMNRSGQAVKDFFAYKNISTDSADIHRDLIVIHDELDFPPGQVKLQRDRSSAGHNGVQSIIDALGTKDFSRLRIGIGRSTAIPTEEYVLQTIPSVERDLISAAVASAVKLLKEVLEKK